MTSLIYEAPSLSAECRLAKRPGYRDLHDSCHQLEDNPLPHGVSILLQSRCACSCHRSSRRARSMRHDEPQDSAEA
jgi:hypothetical protein